MNFIFLKRISHFTKCFIAGLLLTPTVFAQQSNFQSRYDALMKSIFTPSMWDVEFGTRFWFGSGTDGAPNPLLNSPPVPDLLASRLIFDDLDGYTGEVYARVDHRSGLFVKGFVGAGSITNGWLYDEDFPAGPVYSRTLSATTGNLSYINLDLGHSLVKTAEANVGAFIGYNYYDEHLVSTGCTQLAGSTVCVDPTISANFPGITQDDRYDSFRVGLTTQFWLTNQLQLSAESAYIPYVGYNGMDNHNARELIGPEFSSLGDGMMLEAILKYKLTSHLDIGLGGRYWAWNMRDGMLDFDFLNEPTPTPIQEPSRFTMERFGVFAQANYHWDDNASMPELGHEVVNWRGFYIGGYLGGGWGDDNWSDPFGPTEDTGFINVARVGDSTHATGPLGGVQIGYDWQKDTLVLGIGVDASAANIRGENTCFSGLGGINCERIVNTLGTITGKFGYALDRSLFYGKAGGAWTNTSYRLNGFTNALILGEENTHRYAWGWTLGAGVDHAITQHWISFFEYDYVKIPAKTVAFPDVAIVNTQNIKISQSLNLIKVGLKYKFDV